MHTRPSFVTPAAPVLAKAPPKGECWVHEAKWDGYRCQVVKDGKTVRLFSKTGTDWTKRLPSMVEAMASLPARRGDGCRAVLQR